ncbi:MAG: phosphoadenosine phosphosulfate reductase family protein [Acidobacteriaceae bacterium]
MRFCTSELKTAVIASALKKRFDGLDILNITGVRRQESSSRSRMPVSAPMSLLERKNAAGMSWNAIIEWRLDDVLESISESGLALHEAYTKYQSSRVSCAFCI